MSSPVPYVPYDAIKDQLSQAEHTEIIEAGKGIGCLVYIHYTNKVGFEAIKKSGKIDDKHRQAYRPDSARGVFLCPGNVRMGQTMAESVLFYGDKLNKGKAEYVFLFLLNVVKEMSHTEISGGVTTPQGGKYFQYVFKEKDCTIKFVSHKDVAKDEGNAFVLYGGPNRFEDWPE
jgi:hypothetical protein